ncbi:TRAP transporter small permease [Breoghania sp. L-A4]|uniref:TRAP transporter small permease n=1 Tax=Breoghania sp. L-A4 TaxID=2304600 RepID=UPI000E3600A7|nr:TRAP transporter small permease [Breoghania sp. L-A4]AXS42715.1 TRAP transporter small permease [Breoghania sp. L-A4]
MTPLAILRTAERVFLVTVFLLMVVLFFLNVVVREAGGSYASDFAWIEEAVRLMNIFLVFGALGLALERGRHVGIDTLRNALPTGARRLVLKLIDLVGLVFALYLTVLAWRMVVFVLGTGQRSPTLDIPMGWIYVAPLGGFALLALRHGLSLFGIIDRFSAPDNVDDQATAGESHS